MRRSPHPDTRYARVDPPPPGEGVRVCGSLRANFRFSSSKSQRCAGPVGRGRVPRVCFPLPLKNEGEQNADRRWCGSAAPRWPVSRSSPSPRSLRDHRPVTQAGAPLGALLRRSPSGAGPRFQQRAYALPSASSWQGIVVSPGGAPTPPGCVLCVSTPAGAAPTKARNCRAPAAGFEACSPAPPPACSALKTPHECAPLASRVRTR